MAAPVLPAEDMSAEDQVHRENLLTGSTDWQLTRVRTPEVGGIRAADIEGYCDRQSYRAGDTVRVHVSMAQSGAFQLDVFRTGYYQGCGARLMKSLGPIQGQVQVTPQPQGDVRLIECGWEPTLEFVIPKEWISGVYLGRLTTIQEDGNYWQNYVVFIVRDDRAADILLQCSDNTWQAYNQWPSTYSVYTDPRGNQGPWSHVSFDRPYGKYSQIYDNPQSLGSGEWLCFEFPMAYWLEEHGYDVTYCSNSDMIEPACALRCKAFLSNGHDEYWDIRQYESVVSARDAGVNLLFFSGNSVCWVSPFDRSNQGQEKRRIFRGGPYGGSYRFAEDRHREHGPFPFRGPDEGYLIGARNVEPVNGGGDWICQNESHWMFAGTGMKNGDRIPGLIGWEYHGDPPADLAGLEVVAAGNAWQGGVRPQQWTSTIYPGPKGNFVFNASTIFWCQGLSSPPGHMLPWSHWSRPHGPDKRVQQMTHNLLRRAIGEGR